MITIATIVFLNNNKKRASFEKREKVSTTYINITLHMIPDTNFYIQQGTTAQLTTSKATSIFEAY